MTAAALGAAAATGIATALAAAGPAAGATHAAHAAHARLAAQDRPLQAANDSYSVTTPGTLAVTSRHGVLANDSGGDLQIVRHTAPGHGSLTLNPDGSFNYVPQAGFTGDDTFTYTVTNAVPNRGLEGLTITPDGTTLVGMMQSALQQADLNGKNAKNVVPDRIVTYNLRTHALHEYLYLLHDPKTTGTAVSEITALSDTTFLVDERDGNFPGAGVFKQLWKIDLSPATDVGPAAKVSGATYDAAHGGLGRR